MICPAGATSAVVPVAPCAVPDALAAPPPPNAPVPVLPPAATPPAALTAPGADAGRAADAEEAPLLLLLPEHPTSSSEPQIKMPATNRVVSMPLRRQPAWRGSAPRI